MNRRGFLAGLTGLLVAPSIVRVASIMPVSVPHEITLEPIYGGTAMSAEFLNSMALSFGDIIEMGGRYFIVARTATS